MSENLKGLNELPAGGDDRRGFESLGVAEENSSFFQEPAENLPAMFYTVEPDPPFSLLSVSPGFQSLGYPLDDWKNDAEMWRRILYPEDRRKFLADRKIARQAGSETSFEYRLVTRDGRIRWVRDCGCFVRDRAGSVVCWQGVITDITDRREALEKLSESEARFRNLVENANDLIYVHDLAGNYISCNQAAERVFGYTRQEVLAMNMRDVVAPEHLRMTSQMLARKIASGAGQTVYEVDCLAKNGRRITLEVNSSIIYQNGVPVAVQGIARDITERKAAEEALRASEERTRDLFENANDLIYTADLDGYFTSINRAGERITGYTRAEADGGTINFAEVVAPEYLEKARRMLELKITEKVPVTYEVEIITKHGRRVSLELSTRLISRGGKPVGVQGIGRDITERKRAEAALHKTVSLLSSTLESSNDGIVVVNSAGEIVVNNEKFLRMWHIPAAVIGEKNVVALLDYMRPQVLDAEGFEKEIARFYDDPLATCLSVLRFRDGRIFEMYSQPQYLAEKPIGRVVSFRDITERVNAEEKLIHYALHDTLTNLPNRAEFMNHLERAIERGRRDEAFRFAVLFLDLDRFKVINDSLGHVVGDKLLMTIAKRLMACVRPRDVVSRLGGDEFTILLNGWDDISGVMQVAERIQTALAKPFKIDNYEIFTSASIGIIVSDENHRQPEDFLRDADTAMYRAKDTGKARCEIFDHAMHIRNMNLLRIENDLRRALDRHELRVFYQPIVDLRTGRIVEFEALVRWLHPEFGLTAPDEFICVAEETGLIVPIGKWVIEEACRQICVWQNLFPRAEPLKVSVNLSAKQLMHPSLVGQVREVLAETGLKPRFLNLEVTESVVMEHSEKALNVLNELSALGIGLSTDDFGTGYSSLSYLHRFPFNHLKIDRSFISKMGTEEKSGEIVRTILMLAQNLRLEAIAEGVETEEQFVRLRELGCNLAQGYFFTKPIAAAEAEKLLVHGTDYRLAVRPVGRRIVPDSETLLEMQNI
ncbi:MAG: PAS domain S-box protein [Acidobacteria bacterium]|nr:PAS domain S-box protein [Acidobacteriota bacterium]